MKMVTCPACNGAGFNTRGTDCYECKGVGKVESRVLPSQSPNAPRYFRGALVKTSKLKTQN